MCGTPGLHALVLLMSEGYLFRTYIRPFSVMHGMRTEFHEFHRPAHCLFFCLLVFIKYVSTIN